MIEHRHARVQAFRPLPSRCALLACLLLGATACNGDEDGDDKSAADAEKLIGDLPPAEFMDLCRRTTPYVERAGSIEAECELSGLALSTSLGEAPFSRAECIETRESCLDELRMYDVDYDEAEPEDEADPECGHLSWFGPGMRETCDVTVGEFESCWKKMADWAASVSCERPGEYSYAKDEAISECFGRMEARCESFE